MYIWKSGKFGKCKKLKLKLGDQGGLIMGNSGAQIYADMISNCKLDILDL